jgi:class 3 adenylate cyclase
VPNSKPELPTGTVTFVFTDIEGSTRLLQALGERYVDVLERHQRVIRGILARRDGIELGTEGDSFFVVFRKASNAVQAAVEMQQALAAEGPDGAAQVLVRAGIHSGEGRLGGASYVGLDVHRAARVAAAGHGGQVLLTDATMALIGELPRDVAVMDLGDHRLKDLARPEHLYQLVVPGLQSAFPPLRTLDGRAHNLPPELDAFIGREGELQTAEHLLEQSRLLTFTGPGGVGKSRLARQIGERMSRRFRSGVEFVALAAIRNPDLVPSEIGQSIGLPEIRWDERPYVDRLTEYFRDKELLLILDNFEQVVPAAPLVPQLLGASPGLRTLVTSRAPLRLSGEQEFGIPPLRVSPAEDTTDIDALAKQEAVALFVDRARAVKPEFELTRENAPHIAAICVRLDGLPLAIELAAARIRLLTPEAILARLEKRLPLLTGGSRDLPARQQTLQQAIAWSHDLLEPPQRRLFARLSVFVGGAGGWSKSRRYADHPTRLASMCSMASGHWWSRAWSWKT